MTCECPICLDAIIGSNNKTITDCGHKFHTSCLMQNVSLNGFGCPYCRDKLFKPIDKEIVKEPLIPYNFHMEEMENYVLRGFRWLDQRNNNDNLEPEYPDYYPNVDENIDDWRGIMAPLEEVIKELKKSKINNNELIEYILEDYKFENLRENLKNKSFKKIYTKLRQIDTNYKNKLRLERNRNTDYYEDFVNEFQHTINESNNI